MRFRGIISLSDYLVRCRCSPNLLQYNTVLMMCRECAKRACCGYRVMMMQNSAQNAVVSKQKSRTRGRSSGFCMTVCHSSKNACERKYPSQESAPLVRVLAKLHEIVQQYSTALTTEFAWLLTSVDRGAYSCMAEEKRSYSAFASAFGAKRASFSC